MYYINKRDTARLKYQIAEKATIRCFLNCCFLTNAISVECSICYCEESSQHIITYSLNRLFTNSVMLLAYIELLLTLKRKTKRNFASISELKTTDNNCEHLLCASLSLFSEAAHFWIRPMNDVKGCYVAANDVKTSNQPTTSIW